MDDRRNARRFLMNLPVEVTDPSAVKAEATSAKTRDVSFRGLYFIVDRDFEAGSPVEFILTLPKEITLTDDVRVQCVGRVVRVERIEAGKYAGAGPNGGWVGVAAVIEQYDFLPPTS